MSCPATFQALDGMGLMQRHDLEVLLNSESETKANFVLPLLVSLLFCVLGIMHYFAVSKFAVNVPFWDEWESLNSPHYLQQLNLSWFMEQHNEHRIVPTKIQTWLLYQLNGWNLATQIRQNFLIYVFTVTTLLLVLVKGDLKKSAVAGFFSLFLLSTAAYENHSWGFQSQFHFVLLFSFWTCWFLFREHATWKYTFAAAASATLCLYSFSAGVPILLGISACYCAFVAYRILVLDYGRSELYQLLVYHGVVVASVVCYFSFGYHKVQGHPAYTLPHQGDFWMYYSVLIAKGFGIKMDSFVPGLVILIMLAGFVLVYGLKVFRQKDQSVFFWRILAVSSSILLCLAAITIGRAGFGYADSARSSRYVELTSVLIPVMAVLVYHALDGKIRMRRAVLLFCALLLLYSHRKGWNFQQTYQEVANQRLSGLECLKASNSTSAQVLCTQLYPWDLSAKLKNAVLLDVSFVKQIPEQSSVSSSIKTNAEVIP